MRCMMSAYKHEPKNFQMDQQNSEKALPPPPPPATLVTDDACVNHKWFPVLMNEWMNEWTSSIVKMGVSGINVSFKLS